MKNRDTFIHSSVIENKKNSVSEKFICSNGKFFRANTALFSTGNRAFRYGDALFETIRLMNGNILFLNTHFERLTEGMKFLKMNVPDFFSVRYFELLLKRLADKNDVKNARIRWEVYRNDGGLYAPMDNTVSFTLEMEHIPVHGYVLNETGLQIALYTETPKPVCALSNLKTTSALCNVLAGLYMQKINSDDCLLLNTKGNIAEAVSSNIFIIRNNIFLTPALTEGCVDGIMRKQIINILRENGIKITEQKLTICNIEEADEIFLTNVIHGIRWVKRFGEKEYSSQKIRWLMKKIQRLKNG